MRELKASAVVPARNAAAWWGERLESNGSQHPHEIIVVHGCSTDDTVGIAKPCAARQSPPDADLRGSSATGGSVPAAFPEGRVPLRGSAPAGSGPRPASQLRDPGLLRAVPAPGGALPNPRSSPWRLPFSSSPNGGGSTAIRAHRGVGTLGGGASCRRRTRRLAPLCTYRTSAAAANGGSPAAARPRTM